MCKLSSLLPYDSNAKPSRIDYERTDQSISCGTDAVIFAYMRGGRRSLGPGACDFAMRQRN
jgi:hypothetical protein